MKVKILGSIPFRPNALNYWSNVSGMLIRQFQFPREYNPEKEMLISVDDDQLQHMDEDRFKSCLEEHTGSGIGGLTDWALKASSEQIFEFLKDIFKNIPSARQPTNWTGFRILGSVHRAYGHVIYTLELFGHKENNVQN